MRSQILLCLVYLHAFFHHSGHIHSSPHHVDLRASLHGSIQTYPHVPARSMPATDTLLSKQLAALSFTSTLYQHTKPILSSLMWIVYEQNRMTISVSLLAKSIRTLVEPDVPIQLCVDLLARKCRKRGRKADVSVKFPATATATFVWDTAPIVRQNRVFDADRKELRLSINTTNSSYFCIVNFIPQLFLLKSQWNDTSQWKNAFDNEIFAFRIQLHGVQISNSVPQNSISDSTRTHRQPPVLASIAIRDQYRLLGSDCGQLLVHRQKLLRHGLSVFSVMSIVIYAIVLVGAILITRMNGITFSVQTFFDDMTAVSIILIFTLGIVSNALWYVTLNYLHAKLLCNTLPRISETSSQNVVSTSTHLYYLLAQIEACIKWTMMTSVCFHWADIVLVTNSRRKTIAGFLSVNFMYYSGGISMILNFSAFFKCTYDDYLYNPQYEKSMCGMDYCPDLQPLQWKYASTHTCRDVPYSDWFFPVLWSQMLLIFGTTLGLLILGVHIVQRGTRILQQFGNCTGDRYIILQVMKKSLTKFVLMLGAIWVTSSLGMFMSLYSSFFGVEIHAIPWYICAVWLPTIVPPCAFLMLQWNPRLQHLSWEESAERRSHAQMSNRKPRNSFRSSREGFDYLHSDHSNEFEEKEERDYNSVTEDVNFRMDRTTRTGRNLEVDPLGTLTIAMELKISRSSNSMELKPSRCFIELYTADLSGKIESDEMEDAHRHTGFAPSKQSSKYPSLSNLVQRSLQENLWQNVTSSKDIRGDTRHPMNTLRDNKPHANTLQRWKRIGITETAISICSDGAGNQLLAVFSSILQVPVLELGGCLLRFLVYELHDVTNGSKPIAFENRSSACRNSLTLDLHDDIPSAERGLLAFTCFDPVESSPDRAWAHNSSIATSRQSRKQLLCDLYCRSTDLLHVRSKTLTTTGKPQKRNGVVQLSIKPMMVTNRPVADLRNACIARCFQFTNANEFVAEEMSESVLAIQVPLQMINLLYKERTKDLENVKLELQQYKERSRGSLFDNLYDNVIDQIQDENDQLAIQTWLEERVYKRSAYVELLNQCRQVYSQRDHEGKYFKACTETKCKLLQFLPINLHMQDMWVGPMESLSSQKKRMASSDVHSYSIITVGAFAAHSLRFRHGDGILGLEGKMNKLVSSKMAQPSSKSGSSRRSRFNLAQDTSLAQTKWKDPEIQQQDELRWQITTRMDICFTQALTTCIITFCRSLEMVTQKQAQYDAVLNLWTEIGFLLHVESLLSASGKELGMLEDFAAAVDMLKCVAFRLEIIASTSRPLQSPLETKTRGINGISVANVRLTNDVEPHLHEDLQYKVTVRLAVDASSLHVIPLQLSKGQLIKTIPVIFTQGISELQNLTKGPSMKKVLVQNTINQKSLIELNSYIDQYRLMALQQVGTPKLQHILRLQAELKGRIIQAARQTMRGKDPKLLQTSSQLCRLLGAGRITASRNGVDRASMSVTLEQAQILVDQHQAAKEDLLKIALTMRSNGVRLINACKNTQKSQYAFNFIQRSMLPEDYRCPEGTYGRGTMDCIL